MKKTEREYTMKRWGTEPDGKIYLFEDIEECNFPFQLYIPYKINENPDIIVASRTPRLKSNLDFNGILTDAAYEYIEEINDFYPKGPNPVGRLLSYNLGNICLMPVIPRAAGLEAPYLSYKIYNNIFDEAYDAIDKGESNIKKDDVEKFRDLHLQVEKMIIEAINYLKEQNINVNEKVIMTGFSAAAKFSMFFSALHPELVKAIIAGGTGGNNILPDENLNYPLGMKDISKYEDERKQKIEIFRNIPQFYFIGDIDYNDLTMYKTYFELLPEDERKEGKSPFVKDVSGNNIPRRIDGVKAYHDEIRKEKDEEKIVHIQEDIPFDKLDFDLDENGNYQLAYDGGYYTFEQIKYIVENIGHNPQIRFKKMEELYKDICAIFKRYDGDHQTVFNNEDLYNDIMDFYNNYCKKEVIVKR